MKIHISPQLELWAGRLATAIPATVLILSAIAKFVQPPGTVELLSKFGYDSSLLRSIAVLECVCTAIYLIPRTTILGAILLTGYFGGAIASHLRIYDAFLDHLALGFLVWGGVWLRERRLRCLLPVRR